MDLSLSGKTAIVTGAGSNIGRAIALTLGAEGAKVVIADLDGKQGSKVAAQIEAAGGRSICIKTDVTSLSSVEAMFKQALETFAQVHILVNNVGWDKPQYFLETDPTFWDKIIALNYRSHLNTHRTILPHMKDKGYGRVVNLASDAGRMGEFREAVYAGSKGGIIAFSKSVARELGRHNITINVVCPGATIPDESQIGEHSMWKPGGDQMNYFTPENQQKAAKAYPLRRLGNAQDMANAVVFLASDAASYITGQTLSVSGGYTMM